MTFESFFTSRLDSRLRQRRLLTLHDPEGRYRETVFSMENDRTTVLDCGGDLLEARENALEALSALGEDATCKRMLVLYVPAERALEDTDLCSDPFAAFVAAGAVFPDGASASFP
ncbi:MAG: hypothetical protein ACRDBP_03670 [Luteolibacter sp.]